MTATDPVAEAPETAPRAGRRTVPLGAFVVAVLAAVAMALVAIVAANTEPSDDTRAARVAAGQFVERFLTFDSADLSTWSAEVRTRIIPSFEAEFAEFEQEILSLAEAGGATSFRNEARVSELYVAEVERGTVAVVVQFDWQTTNAGVFRDQYVQLLMVELDGSWLVSDVIDLRVLNQRG